MLRESMQIRSASQWRKAFMAQGLIILFLKALPKEDARGIKQDVYTKLFRACLKNQVEKLATIRTSFSEEELNES